MVLLAPDILKNNEKNIENIYDFYEQKNFIIKKLWYPNYIGGAFFYSLAIFIYLIINNIFLFDLWKIFVWLLCISFIKKKSDFEEHGSMTNTSRHVPIIFKQLIKNKYFLINL